MRVFTDGACSSNGRPGAKAGFAAWFPEHPAFSSSGRVPAGQSQTNQRAELSAIHLAVIILEEKGYCDEDIVLYTDSDYSINCLTKWIPGWVSRGWKTSAGKDVLHRDLIEEVSKRLSKFKSYRFHHVKAHTGGEDDLSKNNDVVDRMARKTIDDTVEVETPAVTDEVVPGCPLRLMGPPTSQAILCAWLRENVNTLDRAIVEKHLFKAFAEICKAKDVTLTKQTLQRTPMVRAEHSHLQISGIHVEKVE